MILAADESSWRRKTIFVAATVSSRPRPAPSTTEIETRYRIPFASYGASADKRQTNYSAELLSRLNSISFQILQHFVAAERSGDDS